MKLISFKGALGAATALTGWSLALAAPAFSAPQSEYFLGHIGLQIGVNDAYEVDQSISAALSTEAMVQGDVAIGYRIPLWYFGAEANIRYDDFASSSTTNGFSSDQDPEWQGTAALHLLYDVTSKTRIGVFGQYGDTLPQDGNEDNAYDYFLFGAQAQTSLADNVTVFTQLAYGDKNRDGQDADEGFSQGYVIRGGMAFFATPGTTVVADLEWAASRDYIDNSDPGRHFGFSLSGETLISDDHPLFVTYGGQYTHINSTDESDQVDEWTAVIGLKFAFGAESGRDRWTNGAAMGVPRLPVRASAFTEWID